jgi:hypothetical protein
VSNLVFQSLIVKPTSSFNLVVKPRSSVLSLSLSLSLYTFPGHFSPPQKLGKGNIYIYIYIYIYTGEYTGLGSGDVSAVVEERERGREKGKMRGFVDKGVNSVFSFLFS